MGLRMITRLRSSSVVLSLCIGSVLMFFLPGYPTNVQEIEKKMDGLVVPGLSDSERADLPWWEGGECRCQNARCFPPTTPTIPRERMGGTCGLRAWRAGSGQRVITYALYGNNSIYLNGLKNNVNATRHVYPGWSVWLYTDPRGRHDDLCPLLHDFPHLFICDVTNLPAQGNVTGMRKMLWRALPLGDPHVDVTMSRDTDARILEREVSAVNEWLATNRTFHVMRDHHNHCARVMGGMWGMRMDKTNHEGGGGGGGGVKEVEGDKGEGEKEKEGGERGSGNGTRPSGRDVFAIVRKTIVEQGSRFHKDENDQGVLGNVLWVNFKENMVAHSSFCCEKIPEAFTPFPTQRVERSFIGNKDYGKHPEGFQVRIPCPEACRSPKHRDWEYC
ncbi:uncharacterized protein LOC122255625 [Penaeus japonicus]|uniref:uncharacterized protein LOC122255625 n=1 Tax=Penaeus japonicus TaxID=27405 RepID=UPI001C717861|nr:uncharacterized protein LOC122255625 [Penaeus japonicus]